jgi:SNF2 family DNA or RNA helicase
MEPQWNPSIEMQAIRRALRLDQTKQVTILRYITQDTVEEESLKREIPSLIRVVGVPLILPQSSVLSRQTHKLDLAGGGFSSNNGGIANDKL